MRRVLLLLIPILWLLLILKNYPGRDYYPLYWSAERLLAKQSPYGPRATAELAAIWHTRYRWGGVAYPLPLMLLITPLTLLPFTLSAYVWNMLGTLLASLCLRLRNDWRSLVPLPFLFLPLYRAADLSQATLLWFGLTVLLLLCVQQRRAWLLGICSTILVLKPQNGLLFAIYGLWWIWQNDRRTLLSAGLVATGLGGLAWIAQPTWLWDWLDQMKVYSDVVQPVSLLPWGLIIVVMAWRLPWWARIAALQAVLFPVVEAYSLLPLLLVWVAIGGRLALMGAAISWLWIIFLPEDYRNILALWGLILVPLMAASVWRTHSSDLYLWRKHLTAQHAETRVE